jgi:AhpD family alkylhydroperoxidase
MKLDNRTTELIAVGASVTANCLPCLEYHAGKAAECGVDEEEISQAAEVGRMVRRGAAVKMDKLIESLHRTAPSGASGSTAGCGCA